MTFGLGYNWIEAKNYYFTSVKIQSRPKNHYFISVKNWTKAKRFVKVQKSQITFFFFFLAFTFSLSTTHLRCHCCAPTTRDYSMFGSFVFWLGEVRFGAREVGVILLCCRCVAAWCCAWMEICHWRWRDV